MVTPVSCMTTSAVRIDSGMLIAATIVARRLSRNRKIVRIAKTAPRPPSRSSPSRDSLMKTDRSWTVVTVISVGVAGGDLGQLGLDGVGDLDRVGVRGLGDGQRQRRLAVGPAVAGDGDLSSSTVPRSSRVTGFGAAGAAAAERCRCAGDVRGCAADGTPRSRRRALDLRRPMVEPADRRDRDLRPIGGQLAGRKGQVVGAARMATT